MYYRLEKNKRLDFSKKTQFLSISATDFDEI